MAGEGDRRPYALAAYDDHYAGYVIDKVKQAGIHMITNPVTNLMLPRQE